MATRKYEVELSDTLAQYFGNSKEEIEERLFEDAILTLLSNGKINVAEAAELLNCDPDELLTPEEEANLSISIEQSQRGETITLDQLKEKHSL